MFLPLSEPEKLQSLIGSYFYHPSEYFAVFLVGLIILGLGLSLEGK